MTDSNVDSSIILPVLKRIPLFSGLNEAAHKEIITRIVMMYYPINYQLFKEGDEGDALYIVKKGQIQIYHEPKEAGDLSQKVAIIDDNGFFGEMALISDQPRNASAKTLTDCEIFILSKGDFKKLLESNTVLAEQMSSTVVSRIKQNDQTK